MRYNLFLILAVLFATNSIAQPTLTAATTTPVIGDAFRNRSCSTSGVTPGASGPSVTWNYSTLTSAASDSTKYIDPVGTPYASTFPTSNLASDQGSYFQYFITNAGTFSFNGVAGSFGTDIFSDPLSVVNYPMTYGDIVVDTYAYFNASASLYSYGRDSMSADAWGTLTLPSGTYNNVLRMFFVQTYTDSDVSGSTAVVTHSKLEYYYWYVLGFHNQIFELDYDASGVGAVLTDVIDRSNSPTGLAASGPVDNGVSVFPNPSNGSVYVSFTSPANADITLSAFDMTGKEVTTAIDRNASIGLNTLEFPVSGLAAGVYQLHIRCGHKLIIKKIQVTN